MLLVIAIAHAHPAALPHVHDTIPAALAVCGFWVVAGAAFMAFALRRRASERRSGPIAAEDPLAAKLTNPAT